MRVKQAFLCFDVRKKINLMFMLNYCKVKQVSVFVDNVLIHVLFVYVAFLSDSYYFSPFSFLNILLCPVSHHFFFFFCHLNF